MSFVEFIKENRVYLQDKNIGMYDIVRHAFTTRLGGVSDGVVKGLNLGFRVNDDRESVIKNYRLVANDLGFKFENFVLSKQTHTSNIMKVTENDKGKGLVLKSDIEDIDGLITNIVDIPLAIFYADCVPVLFFDPESKVIAAAHAGWRGTVSGICEKMIGIMKREYSCSPKDILTAIGPSIGSCCFEVEEDTAKMFEDKFVIEKGNGKYNIDLWKANYEQLIMSGLNQSNISVFKECTKCKSDKYYSYRADKEKTGRMCAVIQLHSAKDV